MVFLKNKFKLISVILCSFLFSFCAHSSDYPTKPINVMVGYAAGGGTDSYARTLASFIH